MKKFVGLIAFLVSLTSIVIVAFFGVIPFSKDKNIFCDYITMDCTDMKYNDTLVVETFKRPSDSEIKVDDMWFDNNYDYRLNVVDTDLLISQYNGEISLHTTPHTYRVGKEVSDKKLNHYMYEPYDYDSYLDDESLNNDIIKIVDKSLLTRITPFTLFVQSNDPKGTFINIRIQINAYKGAM